MKSKLLPVTLIVLVLFNVVLVFMLIKKTHINNKQAYRKGFLTEQLQFSRNQQKTFKHLDEAHKRRMMQLDHQIMRHRDVLFKSFGDEKLNIDSLVTITGKLEAKKDLEIFSFFSDVKEMCTKEQQKKFDEIINKAIHLGKPGSPHKENHPSRNGEMPPPPPI